jgi:uncharacterized protein
VTIDQLAIRPTPTGLRLQLRVIPRARKNQIDGVREGRLLVRVTAPPADSAANEAVVALLARSLRRSKRDIRIVSGETARNKTIDVDGLTMAEVADALRDWDQRPPSGPASP